MPNSDQEFDRFLQKSRALTAAPPPNRVEQTQKVVKSQIQSTVRKPLYSFLTVLALVSLYLAWRKPAFVMRSVLPAYSSYNVYGQGYTVPLYRRFDWISWAKASFCLSLLIWAVVYLLMGAMTTTSGFGKEEGCDSGDEPDSGGYCSS